MNSILLLNRFVFYRFVSNDMFESAIWDKLPEWYFDSFEIARV